MDERGECPVVVWEYWRTPQEAEVEAEIFADFLYQRVTEFLYRHGLHP